MNWHIGQEIICINAKNTNNLKEGKIYTIKGLKQGCCSISIDVGIRGSKSNIICRKCYGDIENNTTVKWKSENRFSHLMDISELESILNKEQIKEKYEHINISKA